jgi:PAS domain S-box-containing protein
MSVWKDSDPGYVGGVCHAVQFYEDETFLHSVVADFLADGAISGEPVVAILREDRWPQIAAQLSRKGVDPETVSFADAGATLGKFLRGSGLDEKLFRTTIGGALESAATRNPGSRLRVYGEMVDILWQNGNADGAIRLEELWNELALEYDFQLLCGYAIGKFFKTSHDTPLERICDLHGHVVPAETYRASEREQSDGRQITLLQQRAAALETELVHRKELESVLREALAARREAEKALRKSEREVIDFIENATVGLHWVGPDGTIIWANDAELKLLGYEAEEYLGRNIVDFHADRSTIDDILTRLAAGEEIRDYEARLKAKDGSIRHVVIDSNVYFDSGKFVHTRCFTRDITERKRLENTNAFLLDATNVLYRSLDLETRLRDLEELIVPRLADRCSVQLASDEVSIDAVSLPLFTPREIVVAMRVGDATVGAITFNADGEERRFTAADLQLAIDFGRRAGVAIENARLYHRAQEANRAKDEFLATLSHELRTPLTAILGWARLMVMGDLDAETIRTAVETIERSARMQAALVDDLLDLSRVVTGKLSLENDLVDLRNVLQGALQTQKLAADAKGIRVEAVVPEDRMVVSGDATRLQQIVWNLMNNAIKFSPAGAFVTVVLDRDDDAARIVVRDNGRGIDANLLPHVFEPFRQGDGASTRAFGGLGLGLAIVKYLVELHGGRVAAASDGEGLGATFTVTLPLASRAAVSAPVIADDYVVDLSGTSVLFVDDDEATRSLVHAILRRCGADIEVVGSVDSACTSLKIRRPDVLVTDIAMPLRDGFALLDHIRAGETTRNIPVVALTAFNPASLESRTSANGFRAFVQKPLDPAHFARVIAGLR